LANCQRDIGVRHWLGAYFILTKREQYQYQKLNPNTTTTRAAGRCLLRTSSMDMDIELGVAKIKILVFGASPPPLSFKTNCREIESTKKYRHISIQTTLLAARCSLLTARYISTSSNGKLLSPAMLRLSKKTQHVGFLRAPAIRLHAAN
jgi:hypothetical protein